MPPKEVLVPMLGGPFDGWGFSPGCCNWHHIVLASPGHESRARLRRVLYRWDGERWLFERWVRAEESDSALCFG